MFLGLRITQFSQRLIVLISKSVLASVSSSAFPSTSLSVLPIVLAYSFASGSASVSSSVLVIMSPSVSGQPLQTCQLRGRQVCCSPFFFQCLPKCLSFHLYYRVSEGLDNCLGLYDDQCLSTFLILYLCYRLSQRVVQCHSLHFVQCRCVFTSTFSRLLTSVWTSASVATSGSLSPEVSASASARLCAGVSTRTLNNTSPSVSQTLKVFTFASLSASVLSSLLQPPILIVSCQKNVSRPLLLLASCCRPEPSFDMASFVANCSSLVHY